MAKTIQGTRVPHTTQASVDLAKANPGQGFSDGLMYIVQADVGLDQLWIYTEANGHSRISFDEKNYKSTYYPDTALQISDWADDSEQTVTIDTQLSYEANDRIEISFDHNNYWIAVVDSYDADTGSITFTINEGVTDDDDASFDIFTFDQYNPAVRNENVLAVKAVRTNYSALLAQSSFTPADQDIALVTHAQGTKYLPGQLGGTFYPAGLYIYNGDDSEWEFLSENLAEGVYEAVQNQLAFQIISSQDKTVAVGSAAYYNDELHVNVSSASITGVNSSTDFTTGSWQTISLAGGEGADLTMDVNLSRGAGDFTTTIGENVNDDLVVNSSSIFNGPVQFSDYIRLPEAAPASLNTGNLWYDSEQLKFYAGTQGAATLVDTVNDATINGDIIFSNNVQLGGTSVDEVDVNGYLKVNSFADLGREGEDGRGDRIRANGSFRVPILAPDSPEDGAIYYATAVDNFYGRVNGEWQRIPHADDLYDLHLTAANPAFQVFDTDDNILFRVNDDNTEINNGSDLIIHDSGVSNVGDQAIKFVVRMDGEDTTYGSLNSASITQYSVWNNHTNTGAERAGILAITPNGGEADDWSSLWDLRTRNLTGEGASSTQRDSAEMLVEGKDFVGNNTADSRFRFRTLNNSNGTLVDRLTISDIIELGGYLKLHETSSDSSNESEVWYDDGVIKYRNDSEAKTVATTDDISDEFAKLIHYSNVAQNNRNFTLDNDHNANISTNYFGVNSAGSLVFQFGEDLIGGDVLNENWDDISLTEILVRLTNQDDPFSEPSVYRGVAFGNSEDGNTFVGLDSGFEHLHGPNVLTLNNSAGGDEFKIEIESDIFHARVFDSYFDGLVPSPSSSEHNDNHFLTATGKWKETIPVVSSDPDSPDEGEPWYNSTDKKLKFNDGTDDQNIATEAYVGDITVEGSVYENVSTNRKKTFVLDTDHNGTILDNNFGVNDEGALIIKLASGDVSTTKTTEWDGLSDPAIVRFVARDYSAVGYYEIDEQAYQFDNVWLIAEEHRFISGSDILAQNSGFSGHFYVEFTRGLQAIHIFGEDHDGLVPGPSSSEDNTSYFLSGNATWVQPPDFTTGFSGYVPGPAGVDATANHYLAGNGTWQALPAGSGVSYLDIIIGYSIGAEGTTTGTNTYTYLTYTKGDNTYYRVFTTGGDNDEEIWDSTDSDDHNVIDTKNYTA